MKDVPLDVGGVVFVEVVDVVERQRLFRRLLVVLLRVGRLVRVVVGSKRPEVSLVAAEVVAVGRRRRR